MFQMGYRLSLVNHLDERFIELLKLDMSSWDPFRFESMLVRNTVESLSQ